MKEENPLDLEHHGEESWWDVWKRRVMFVVLIALCVTMAAPTFSGCESAFDPSAMYARYSIGGERKSMTETAFFVIRGRYQSTSAVLSFVQGRNPDSVTDDDVWRHVLLNEAAEQAGVHIPEQQVDEVIARLFSAGQEFDDRQYRTQLAQMTNNSVTNKAFKQTLRELMRVSTYLHLYDLALNEPSADLAFEEWKNDNEKITAEYVVQEFAPLEEQVASATPSDGDLRAFAVVPSIESKLRLPSKKTVEAAVVRVRDIGVAEMAEIETLVRERKLIADDETLKSLAASEYWSSQNSVFTKANYLKDARTKFDLAMAVHQAKVDAWKAAGEKPEDDPGAGPPDPGEQDFLEGDENFVPRFEKLWQERVSKEVLARELARLIGQQAERENKSFAELLPEYERLGLRVHQNPEPLTDNEIGDSFPDGLGIESEFATVVRSQLRGPEPGRPFTPRVHVEAVPTTRLGSALDNRGYMTLRLAGFEAPRARTLEEARDEIMALWRTNRVESVARERLEAVRDAVVAGTDLNTVAVAAGLEVASLRRFSRETAERKAPRVHGETPDDVRAAAARIRHRNRMVQDYAALAETDVGAFRKRGVLLDVVGKAAYLVRVVEKHEPAPIEMSPTDLMIARARLQRERQQEQSGMFSLESLRKRFRLEVNEPVPDDGVEDESAADNDE